MDSKTAEIISSESVMREILTLKSKDEIRSKLAEKGAKLTDEEFEQFICTICECIARADGDGKISESELSAISGGMIDRNGNKNSFRNGGRFVAGFLSLPLRAVAYTVATVVAGVPKSIYDGVKDVWCNDIAELDVDTEMGGYN